MIVSIFYNRTIFCFAHIMMRVRKTFFPIISFNKLFNFFGVNGFFNMWKIASLIMPIHSTRIKTSNLFAKLIQRLTTTSINLIPYESQRTAIRITAVFLKWARARARRTFSSGNWNRTSLLIT